MRALTITKYNQKWKVGSKSLMKLKGRSVDLSIRLANT